MRHNHDSRGRSGYFTPSDMVELTAAAVSSIPRERSAALTADLNQLGRGLMSDSIEGQLEAARQLRLMLSSERDIVVHEVVERGWTPRLIQWLKLRDHPALQIEGLWALTNIAAGANDNTAVLLHNGIVPNLVSLLDSPNEDVLEQAVWVLGNLASDGHNTRDMILNAHALPLLVKNLKREGAKTSLLRIIAWTISNLCDGQPRPIFNIGIVLPQLSEMLEKQDTEMLSHVCWALSHLCDGPSTHIQAVVNSSVCKRLVELLGHRSWRVTKPALRAIGNIVCAEDDHDYTQHIIECGAVPKLRELIGHSNREIQKEACWTLSNIAAGTIDQIQCVLDSGGIPALIELASSESTDSEVKSEACWVVLNATSCGSDEQIEYLVKYGCISVIRELLQETSMIMMALEGLERILQVGEQAAKRTNGSNPYTAAMQCIDFKLLSEHKLPAVSKKTNRLWQEHFVKCAICELDYSKQSNDTKFCDECKCNVCKNCDCTVFHLKYQESLWKEETDKETSEKQAKQASKKSKRQKKRQRTKEKKAAMMKQQGKEEEEENVEHEEHEDRESEEMKEHHDVNSAEKLDRMVNANDELVSFLNETGSIMALALRLDEDDDEHWLDDEIQVQ